MQNDEELNNCDSIELTVDEERTNDHDNGGVVETTMIAMDHHIQHDGEQYDEDIDLNNSNYSSPLMDIQEPTESSSNSPTMDGDEEVLSESESICFDDFNVEQEQNMVNNCSKQEETTTIIETINQSSSIVVEESEKAPSADSIVEEVIDITEDSQNCEPIQISEKNNQKEIECVSIGSSDEEEDGEEEEDGMEQDDQENNENQDEESDESDEEVFFLTSDEEEDYHPTRVTKRVHKIIDQMIPGISEDGNFSVGGEFDQYPAIGLQLLVPNSQDNTIIERKYVSLPLVTKEQANDIIQLATKAPYGKGEDTVLDENVRRTWQLEPNQFTISNPNWNAMINKLVAKNVRKGLGVGENKEIGFNLYKLLLYEEEGHFDFHRDSEKEEKMFATLVVHLPSVYTGGELIVRHKSKETKYDYSSNSSYASSYVSFYCDCEHKVAPVTSGYRLALVYNIFFKGPYYLMPSVDSSENIVKYMNETLDEWGTHTPYVIHILEHKYTTHGINIEYLKGKDATIYNWLAKYNSIYNKFYICVGLLKKHVSGNVNNYDYCSRDYRNRYDYRRRYDSEEDDSDEDEDDEDDEDVNSEDIDDKEVEYSIVNLRDSSGEFSRHLNHLDVSCVVPYDSLIDLSCVDSSIEHTGNAGVTADRWYESACLIIIPKKNLSQILQYLDDSCKVKYFDRLVDEQIQQPSMDKIFRITEIMKTSRLPENIILNAAAKLKDVNLVIELTNRLINFQSWQTIITHFGLEPLKKQYFKFIISNLANTNVFESTFQTVLSQENTALTSELCDYVFEFLSTTKCLYTHAVQRILNCMVLCAVPLLPNTHKYMISRCELADQTEATLILKYFENFPDYMSLTLITLVKNQQNFLKHYPIIIDYLKYFFTEEIQKLLRTTLSGLVDSNFNAVLAVLNRCNDIMDENDGAKFISSYLREKLVNRFISGDINLENSKSIISGICKKEFPDDLSTVTSAIISKITDFDKVVKFLIPLIKFIETKFGGKVFSSLPAFSLLVHCSIGFIKPILKKQQEVNTNDWSLPTFNCAIDCSQCRKVNNFLQSSTVQTCEVKEALGTRNHVEANMRSISLSYLTLQTIRHGSPHTLLIKKVSNPRTHLSQQAEKTKSVLQYLNSLLINIPAQQQPTAATLDSLNITSNSNSRSASSSNNTYSTMHQNINQNLLVKRFLQSSSYPNKKKK